MYFVSNHDFKYQAVKYFFQTYRDFQWEQF